MEIPKTLIYLSIFAIFFKYLGLDFATYSYFQALTPLFLSPLFLMGEIGMRKLLYFYRIYIIYKK